MFYWSERALSKIERLTMESKRMKLILSMITQFLNLMLDSDDGLSQGNFLKEFMNGSTSLAPHTSSLGYFVL